MGEPPCIAHYRECPPPKKKKCMRVIAGIKLLILTALARNLGTGFSGLHLLLQSIYVTRDRVIFKFEARVQIYVAVLNIGCKIQNSGGNVVSVSKINSCEISF